MQEENQWIYNATKKIIIKVSLIITDKVARYAAKQYILYVDFCVAILIMLLMTHLWKDHLKYFFDNIGNRVLQPLQRCLYKVAVME